MAPKTQMQLKDSAAWRQWVHSGRRGVKVVLGPSSSLYRHTARMHQAAIDPLYKFYAKNHLLMQYTSHGLVKLRSLSSIEPTRQKRWVQEREGCPLGSWHRLHTVGCARLHCTLLKCGVALYRRKLWGRLAPAPLQTPLHCLWLPHAEAARPSLAGITKAAPGCISREWGDTACQSHLPIFCTDRCFGHCVFLEANHC